MHSLGVNVTQCLGENYDTWLSMSLQVLTNIDSAHVLWKHCKVKVSVGRG